jgi:tetratricopeptide (TPR) repeat protein
MPTTTYMGIDERLDHSIRVPRPDLTAKLGTPNACNRCHTKPEEDAQWAAAAVAKWFGEKRPDDPHYAVALHAAQTGAADAVAKLKELFERRDVPDIVRATAAELLSVFPDASERLSRRALDDDSPLVRAAAIRGVAARSPLELIEFVAPKLRDPARAVRMAAANRLVANAAQLAQTEFRGQHAAAVKEYRDGMAATLDRAQTHRNLAGLDEAMGDDVAAVKSLRTAIKLEPYLTVPRTELSQLLAAMRDDPTRAAAWKQSGGSDQEIRRLREEEVNLLERDKELLPGDAFVYYHRGQLLFLLDRVDEARMEFEKACELAPGEYEYWKWLALICERQKRWEQGIVALHKMQELRPNDPEWQLLRQKWLRIVQQDQADAAASDGDAGAADADDATRPESEQDSTAGEAAPLDAPAPKPGPEPPTTPGQKESPRPNAAAE